MILDRTLKVKEMIEEKFAHNVRNKQFCYHNTICLIKLQVILEVFFKHLGIEMYNEGRNWTNRILWLVCHQTLKCKHEQHALPFNWPVPIQQKKSLSTLIFTELVSKLSSLSQNYFFFVEMSEALSIADIIDKWVMV